MSGCLCNLEMFPEIQAILPEQCKDIYVVSCKPQEDGFSCQFFMPNTTEDAIRVWASEFNHVTWRVLKTYPNTEGERVKFKIRFRCQHKTKLPASEAKRTSKNTNCPANMIVTIRNVPKRCRAQFYDILKTKNTMVTINHTHNHSLNSADILKYKDVKPDVKKKFVELFERGFGPSSARSIHLFDLQQEYRELFASIAADRSISPDLQWCHRAFAPVGSKQRKGNMEAMRHRIEEYNIGSEDKHAFMTESDGHVVVALCTPLMKRVHEINHYSGEIAFLDWFTTTKSRINWYIYVIFTYSPVCGLPLGIIMSSDNSEQAIKLGLMALESVFPAVSFYGKGKDAGPTVLITSNCSVQRKAFSQHFTQSMLLTSTFYILQDVWKFLLNPQNGIPVQDHHLLFDLVEQFMHASTMSDYNAVLQAIMSNDVAQKHDKFLDYVRQLHTMHDNLALSFRIEFYAERPTNICDVCLDVMGNNPLGILAVLEPIELLEFFVTRLDSYYQYRLVDHINGRIPLIYMIQWKNNDQLQVSEASSPHMYLVFNPVSSKTCTVNAMINHCQCPRGSTGGYCTHLQAVKTMLQNKTENLSSEWKESLLQIVGGEVTVLENVDVTQGSPMDVDAENANVIIGLPSAFKDFIIIEERKEPDPSYETVEEELVDNVVALDKSKAVVDVDLTELKAKFQSMFDTWFQRATRNAEAFTPAMLAMLKSNDALCVDSSLVAALAAFGKEPQARNPARAVQSPPISENKRLSERNYSEELVQLYLVEHNYQKTNGIQNISDELL